MGRIGRVLGAASHDHFVFPTASEQLPSPMLVEKKHRIGR
jgi:hypothetical protein